MTDLLLQPGRMKLSDWRRIQLGGVRLKLNQRSWSEIDASRRGIERALSSGAAIYGVNTGFGKLAQTRIADEDLTRLQRNLVLSHAAGVGSALGDDTVRLILALKIASLARGFSGVRPIAIETKSS